jgi:murein endopeptidase
VRIYGPADSPTCIPERPLAPDDGCRGSPLDHWFTDGIAPHSAIVRPA